MSWDYPIKPWVFGILLRACLELLIEILRQEHLSYLLHQFRIVIAMVGHQFLQSLIITIMVINLPLRLCWLQSLLLLFILLLLLRSLISDDSCFLYLNSPPNSWSLLQQLWLNLPNVEASLLLLPQYFLQNASFLRAVTCLMLTPTESIEKIIIFIYKEEYCFYVYVWLIFGKLHIKFYYFYFFKDMNLRIEYSSSFVMITVFYLWKFQIVEGINNKYKFFVK